MIYQIAILLFSVILPGVILYYPIKESRKQKEGITKFIRKNKQSIALYFIFMIGMLVRGISISDFPKGLNCDEASASYDAFSIMKTGKDRNGNFLPIFLQAWGSGQNALYSYIMIPFLKLFGLNLIATRLPMVIIGCISLLVWYQLLRNIKNEKFAFIGVAFLSICPWHIMKSRWGLESNIFPDLVLWAIYSLVRFIKTGKKSKLYIASTILAISAYSYGTSYMFLPIFCSILFIYMLAMKKVTIKETILCFCIVLIIALPILGYLAINTFDLEQLNLGFMTIPKLPVNRYEEQTSLFSGNILFNSLTNLKNSVQLLIMQDDHLPWNNLSHFGIYYFISIPFLIIGFMFSFKKNKLKNEFDTLMNIWFISGFSLLFALKEANINRINIMIFPLLYYIVSGLNAVCDKGNKIANSAIDIIYLLTFTFFLASYVNTNFEQYWTFTDDIEEVIEYVDAIDCEKVYFEYAFKEPYIYVLYYTKYDVNQFLSTAKHFDEENLGNFENVKSFGKYHFYLPKNFDEENVVYVICKEHVSDIDENEFSIKEFEKYIVLERNR